MMVKEPKYRKGGYSMEHVCKFLKDADVYYLATAEGGQPRVRPFGTATFSSFTAYPETVTF